MDDPKTEAKVQQQTVLAWALAELGLRVPSDAADQVARAIERAREIDERVRRQVIPRLAFPGRYDDGDGPEPAPPPTADELEALMWELDFRYRQTLQDASEI